MTATALCTERMWRTGGWHSHDCGKPVKRDYQRVGYCGLHASMHERREARNIRRNDEESARVQRCKASNAVADRIHAATGVRFSINYEGDRFTMGATDAARLADWIDSR